MTFEDPPVLHHENGEPVPDLNAIPRDRWFAVLEPLGEDARRQAINATGLTILDDFVADLNYQLMMRPARRRAAVSAIAHSTALPPVPTPGEAEAERERRRRDQGSRQVNLRMGRDEYQQLTDAAAELQMRPTQLARMLVRSGVRRIAYEARVRGDA
jgi:hypothetical protein